MKPFLILSLLLLAGSARATSWRPMLDVEVYERSDWIVVGTLREQNQDGNFSWTIEVEETIKGTPRKTLEVQPNKFMFGENAVPGARYLCGVGTVEGKYYLYHPACLRDPVKGKAAMLAAKKLLDEPATAILDTKGPTDPNVAFIIGKYFALGANIWQMPVSRSAAMDYLRRSLDFERPEAMLETLRALRRTGDRSLEPDIRKLLNEQTPHYAVRDMVAYLEEGGTTEGRRHLEALLIRSAPDYPKRHHLADPSAMALGRIGHPDSIPHIETAAEHGVQRAIEALMQHGDLHSLDMLYRSYLAAVAPGSQPNAMQWLVRRSNRPVEAWMHPSTYSSTIGGEMKAQWKAWWKKHREGLVIVRSFEEARASWARERKGAAK